MYKETVSERPERKSRAFLVAEDCRLRPIPGANRVKRPTSFYESELLNYCEFHTRTVAF